MHSIWLTLDDDARIAAIIADLAARFGRPMFAPHITLLGEIDGPAERTIAAIPVFEQGALARVTGVAEGETYFTSLFLDVALPPVFSGIRAELAEALGCDPKSFRPHVSLAYGDIEAGAKQRLMEEFGAEFEGAEFGISRTCVVASSNDTPVENWRVLWRSA